MAKFLSETGLQTVWSKIDSLFVRKASIVSVPTANSTSPISAGGVYSALEEIEDTVAASENALNTRVTTLENNTVSGSGLTADKIVLGNGGRTVKTSTYGVTTTAPSSSSDDTTIPTSKAVWSAFGSVASALKYKGTIASSGGTVTALPASHAVGDVYVVKTAGTYAGKACEVGDYIICNTAGTTANNADWDVLNGENQVENKSASLAGAGSSATIATVDGTDITVTTPSGWTGLTKTGTVTSVTPGTGLRNGTATTAITGSGTLNLISATTGELGGIKAAAVRTATNLSLTTGGTTSGRYYGVELDGNNKAFVNVPWTSVSDANIKISDGTTTNTIITASCIGTSSKTSTLTISASQNITATVGGSAGAATLTLTGPDLSPYLTLHQTIKQDGITGATVTRFGTCSTAAGTAAKTVSVGSGTVTLEAGLKVTVKFSSANTANSPTLNVNSKGAKNIYHKGSQITTGSNKALLAGTVDFVYDGTQWQLIGNYLDTDTHNTHALTVTNGTASATTGEITYVESVTGCDATSGNLTATTTRKKINVVSSHQTIKQDGITGATVNRYGTCSTAAGTAAKTVSVGSGTPALETGLKVTVYFSAKNTANSPTLNVNSLGAKSIYHNGAVIGSSTNKGLLYGAVDFVYNSTLNSNAGGWQLIGNYIDTNSGGTVTSVTLTSGTGITVSDSGTAITSSGSRTISLASGVATAGTYKSVTVDTYGRVTAGTNPTTLSGYGITDAKIASGVITLGSNTITPLTSASTLDATKLSGTIPASCYTDTNTDIRFADFFGESTTAAGTAAKTTTTTSNSKSLAAGDLVTGLSAIIWHQYANSGSNATLNVGGSGAKAAYNAAGTRISGSTGTWTAKDIIRWVYDSSLNSGSGGWKISAILGNGDSHRFRVLTGGTTPLYSGTTLDSISDGSTRKLANYLPLSGGTMTGAITMSGANILTSADSVNQIGSVTNRFGNGFFRNLYTTYFGFRDENNGNIQIGHLGMGDGYMAVYLEDGSGGLYGQYVFNSTYGFFHGGNNDVPCGRDDHRWSKVWATDADFSGTTTVGGSIYPSTDITSYLGTNNYRFHSACIINHYTRNIVFKNQTNGNDCVQLWGGDGYLRVATGANINSSKKEIIFHENYGLYPELGTTTNLGYYSSTDNRFRWANVYAVNGNFSGTIIANGQTVLDESMALTTSEIDTILANAT